MKCCYLQKKICVTIWDLKKPLWLLHGIDELQRGINDYEKNSLASTFKWLAAWKRGLPRPNFSYENLSSLPNLSYSIIKKPVPEGSQWLGPL